jgi:hypothetical protein
MLPEVRRYTTSGSSTAAKRVRAAKRSMSQSAEAQVGIEPSATPAAALAEDGRSARDDVAEQEEVRDRDVFWAAIRGDRPQRGIGTVAAV